jgi:hypothetical protein
MSDSSSSDDLDLDDLLQDDSTETAILLLAVKELEERAKLIGGTAWRLAATPSKGIASSAMRNYGMTTSPRYLFIRRIYSVGGITCIVVCSSQSSRLAKQTQIT